MSDRLSGVQISESLSGFFDRQDSTVAIHEYASVSQLMSSILSDSSSAIAITVAKEFYSLIEMYSGLPREPLAILCSQISIALFNKRYLKDSLQWMARAIEKDNRRIIFFQNKAIILFSLGLLREVISTVGYVKSAQENFLDFDDTVLVQLLELAANAATKLGDVSLAAAYKNQIASFAQPELLSNQVETVGNNEQCIYLFACCYNELDILPFFLDYYKNFVGVEKFFIFDGGSTDGSLELLESYNATIIQEKHDTLNDLVLMDFRNNFYKSYRDQCDWVIVCDTDEFLYHPNIKSRLKAMSEEGITIPKVSGYGMVSLDIPNFQSGTYLPHLCRKGNPEPHSTNKNLIFNPLLDINYSLGCHHCAPSGNVVFSSEYELKNLHYMNLSFAQVILKSERQRKRLSEWNKSVKAGVHYEHRVKTRLTDYLREYESAMDVV